MAAYETYETDKDYDTMEMQNTPAVYVNEITSVTIQINCPKLAKDDLFWIGMFHEKTTKEFKWLSGKPLRLPHYWYEDKPPAKPEGKLNRYPQHHL